MALGDVEPAPRRSGAKSATAFRTISEVGKELEIPQHVLRFWESKFSQVKPLKRGGGRRYYRPEDIALLRRIRDLLYTEGYTIRGVQRLFREVGVKAVVERLVAEEGAPLERSVDPLSLGAGSRTELEAVLSELIALRHILKS